MVAAEQRAVGIQDGIRETCRLELTDELQAHLGALLRQSAGTPPAEPAERLRAAGGDLAYLQGYAWREKMPIAFSGRPSPKEQVQAVRLVAWSIFEIVVLAGMVALAAIVGVAVPWSQGNRFPTFSVLTLFGLFFVLLGRRQVRRKQLVREQVTADQTSGNWDDDALQFSRPRKQSVSLLPRNLRDCQIGAEALIVWCQDLPFVVTASLFSDRVDWLRLHTHVDQARRRPRAIRRLLLTASLVGWMALLVFAWNAWEAWAR